MFYLKIITFFIIPMTLGFSLEDSHIDKEKEKLAKIKEEFAQTSQLLETLKNGDNIDKLEDQLLQLKHAFQEHKGKLRHYLEERGETMDEEEFNLVDSHSHHKKPESTIEKEKEEGEEEKPPTP